MESRLAELGEKIYEENRVEWERAYLGKIIAMEVESRSLADVGNSLLVSPFYFRKVGPCATLPILS